MLHYFSEFVNQSSVYLKPHPQVQKNRGKPGFLLDMNILHIESSVPAASYFRPLGLSSPQLRLTAVFGMGTGVAIAPNHQNTGFNMNLIISSNVNHANS